MLLDESAENVIKTGNVIPNRSGKLRLILGCMWSGKTSELISRYNRYTLGGKKCLMIKYKYDTRYTGEDKLVTHSGIVVNSVACSMLYELEKVVNAYQVICIDEIQFFKDGHIFSDKWANEGKIVEVCGLNGTSERKPFDVISKLVPLVDKIKMFNAVCKETGKSAIYSHRFSDDVGEIVIAGDDKYVALDRNTYLKENYESIIPKQFMDFIELIDGGSKNVIGKPSFDKKINFSDYITK